MPTVTVITDDVHAAEGRVQAGRVTVGATALGRVLGWELKPEGLCREDVCVPVRDPAALRVGDGIDVAAAAGALGRPAVVDAALGVVAIALPSEERRRTLDGLVAAPFTLPDLDGAAHELAEWRGRKKLLVAFSSW